MASRKKTKELREQAISWFWVILFISSIFFLRGLLVEMHTETLRLTEERKQLETRMEEEREESEDLFQKLYSELNAAIKEGIKAINSGKASSSFGF